MTHYFLKSTLWLKIQKSENKKQNCHVSKSKCCIKIAFLWWNLIVIFWSCHCATVTSGFARGQCRARREIVQGIIYLPIITYFIYSNIIMMNSRWNSIRFDAKYIFWSSKFLFLVFFFSIFHHHFVFQAIGKRKCFDN